MRQLLTVLVSVALLGGTGCSTTRDLVTAMSPVQLSRASDAPRVTKVMCLWESGIGKLPNGPKRGILGQVLFLEGTSDVPVEVDGSVTVYLFDDQGTPEQQAKPIQKLVLTPEELQATHMETSVGHSYHIPVPYLRNHDLAATCALRVKYTSPNGDTTYSDLNSVYLEGKDVQTFALSKKRVTGPVTRNTASQEAKTTQPNVTKIGTTEIHEAEAGTQGLKSLTIRRELPLSRQTRPTGNQATRSNGERSRTRFQLSNTATPADKPSTVTANDFAPLD